MNMLNDTLRQHSKWRSQDERPLREKNTAAAIADIIHSTASTQLLWFPF